MKFPLLPPGLHHYPAVQKPDLVVFRPETMINKDQKVCLMGEEEGNLRGTFFYHSLHTHRIYTPSFLLLFLVPLFSRKTLENYGKHSLKTQGKL